jgi:hypothetical protein
MDGTWYDIRTKSIDSKANSHKKRNVVAIGGGTAGGAMIGGLLGGGKGAAVGAVAGAGAGTAGAAATGKKEITFAAEAPLTFVLRQPVSVTMKGPSWTAERRGIKVGEEFWGRDKEFWIGEIGKSIPVPGPFSVLVPEPPIAIGSTLYGWA